MIFNSKNQINSDGCSTIEKLVEYFAEGNSGCPNHIKNALGMCGKTSHNNLKLLLEKKVVVRNYWNNRYSLAKEHSNSSSQEILELILVLKK
ncbi:hypothetical protein J4411_01455 [Candidatus Pacearchaeota archaeon]|nr:hypothetical protein [Candidatus Pacearchaeota archaeon]